MHGAGNDFILVDARQLATSLSRAQIAAWCHRRTGVGSDGLILLHPPRARGHFRMQFFNPDGSEADMCGNGARCAARLAFELNLAPATMTIETAAGAVQAALLPDSRVRLELPPPQSCRLDGELTLDRGDNVHYAFANTGVPHAVIECATLDTLDTLDIREQGRAIRMHPCFAPQGTNVDFIAITGPGSLRIRTYERGVEDETLACGTGIAAAAATAVLRGRVISPVTVQTAGGDRLEVAITPSADGPGPITLTGPAVHTFTGELGIFHHTRLL
jgi:diaminopimelate epimerase